MHRRLVLTGLVSALVASGSTRAQVKPRDQSAAPEKLELTLALLREGAIVGRSSPALPGPDDKGQIAYIATIPSTGLTPGRHEVRAILRQGALAAEETTFFNIGAPASASAEAPPGKVR